MDAVDVAGFLEFDSIVIRDGLLESTEAVQQIVAKKWPFTKECRPHRGDDASGVGVRVEGEVVYLDVEEEDDQDVDVEGDETASVTRSPVNIRSQGVGIRQTEVPCVAEPEKPRRPSEATRTNHICVVTSETGGSPQSRPYGAGGIAGTPSSSGSDVPQIPKVTTEKLREPPVCQIRSGDSGGVPRPKDSATSGSGVDSTRGDGRTAGSPSRAGASALPETAGDACVYLWKSTLGVCGICGKMFNNNSNLKRHALVHGRGILLTCDVCGQFFPDRWSLWKHKDRHAAKVPSKMYKCSVCGKCVNSSHSLRKHRAQHVQPYVCDVCGESFHRASGLQIHKYLHAR